jgi:CDP-glucose 4,6-dehydratase
MLLIKLQKHKKNKVKILVTGHTGFKGTWLIYLLRELGHDVFGISLDPLNESMFNITGAKNFLSEDIRLDIRNKSLEAEIKRINPEVIFHLAAQPIVLDSLVNPRKTIDINVMGTLNILEVSRNLAELQALLIVTTDKVYKNQDTGETFKEQDPLGGDDPYSASKSMSDLLTQSYVKSYNLIPTSILRAGNVIGGGDFSENRIIPDLYRAIHKNEKIKIRNPEAIRPWEHVLDCLYGYVLAMSKLLDDKVNTIYNFGPDADSYRTVRELVTKFNQISGGKIMNEEISQQKSVEKKELRLDAGKSHLELGWKPLLNFEESLAWTYSWYEAKILQKDMSKFTVEQIRNFLDRQAVKR